MFAPRKIRLTLAIALTAMAFFPSASFAQVFVYATSTSGTLSSVDLTSGTATTIGSTGTNFLEGLAIAPSGILYATDTSGSLYTLNTSTGAATLVGTTALGNVEALDFVGSALVGLSFTATTPTLFSLNTATAAVTNLVTLTSSLSGSPRALAAYDSNTAYVAADASGGANLYTVNMTTGAVTLVGLMSGVGSSGQFAAMDFAANGNLYGLDNNGAIWSINPSTAAVTLLGNTGSQFWLDMTIQSVPEPSTYALLALGLGLIVWVRRRR
jgi:hypothetical protein